MPSHAKSSRGRVVITATAAAGLLGAVVLWPAQADQTPTSFGQVVSCVSDAQSGCTITHNLGVKPVITGTVGGRGQLLSIPSDKVTETTFRANFNWRTGSTFAAGTRFTFQVHYDLPDVAPTPTPSPTPTVTSPTPTVTPTPTPTATPGACDTAHPAYQTSSANGSWIIDPADPGGVQVNNNVWSPTTGWAQTLYACSKSNWSIIANQPGTGDNDGVKSYPDTQYHVRLPVNSMTTLPSSWSVKVPSPAGSTLGQGKQWNAAYDLWIGDTSTSRFDTEVMVWTAWNANWKYWYDQLHGEQVTLDGVSYSVYHRAGSSGQAAGIWFIRNTQANEGTVDLAKLLKWAQAKGWMPATSVMHEVEYGFEVLYTGEPTRFDLLDFTLTTS